MGRAVRFVVAWTLGLGLLTWIGRLTLTHTTRRWFERDIELRARLAVASARRSLLRHRAAGEGGGLPYILADLTGVGTRAKELP